MNIKIGYFVELFIHYLLDHFKPFFSSIANIIEGFMVGTESVLLFLPPLVFIGSLVIFAWIFTSRKIAFFSFFGLLLVFGMGLWISFIQTFVLVLVAGFFSLFLGIPIGILCSKSKHTDRILTPTLDFMQTMPPFVYLIPAVMFFGIGQVPAVISTVIFAMPPAIRLTRLGLNQVPDELIEVGNSFGFTPFELLLKIQLPMALPSIMAGVNQSIMLSLSMVVIASMIGASGLGSNVLNGIQKMEIGVGFEAGLSVVILAIMLDRITSNIKFGKKNINK
ncbi:MAG TPA: proline/glycine betaine ABC transporter permease [Clostridia bacterium]|nr:proline/glycine betaine ABC transporter permease [Clostridia bacterium]